MSVYNVQISVSKLMHHQIREYIGAYVNAYALLMLIRALYIHSKQRMLRRLAYALIRLLYVSRRLVF